MPSVENLRDFSDSGSYQPLAGSLQVPNYYAEAPLDKPAEELIVVELHREASGHKLGLGIVGGADNPRLPEVHVSIKKNSINTIILLFFLTGEEGHSRRAGVQGWKDKTWRPDNFSERPIVCRAH